MIFIDEEDIERIGRWAIEEEPDDIEDWASKNIKGWDKIPHTVQKKITDIYDITQKFDVKGADAAEKKIIDKEIKDIAKYSFTEKIARMGRKIGNFFRRGR